MALSFITVNLATVCIESMLYGIFLLLFGTSTYLLVRQGYQKLSAAGSRPYSLFRAPMFLAANLIFCTVTGHWICTVLRLFDAFVNYNGGTEPLYIYANLALATEVVKSGLLVATLVTSDAMIIYRLFIIWGYNKWIIIFPLLTWLGLIVCGAGVCWQFAEYKFGEDVFTSLAGRWITSDCVFTFTTNMYCSALISWRVWRTRIRTKSYGGSNMLGALAIIVESALLHTTWNLFFFILYQTETNLQFTAIDLWAPISGIAFMLINLRVALGWAQRATSQHQFSSSPARLSYQPSLGRQPSFVYQSSSHYNGSMSSPPHSPHRPMSFGHQYPPPALLVNINRVVDQADDMGSVVEKPNFADESYGLAV